MARATAGAKDVRVNCTLHDSTTDEARLDFRLHKALPAGADALTLTIPRGAGLAPPSRGVLTTDPIILSYDGPGMVFEGVPSTVFCSGVCETAWAWDAGIVGNQTTAATFHFRFDGSLKKGDAMRLRLPRFKKVSTIRVDAAEFGVAWDGEYLSFIAKEAVTNGLTEMALGVDGFRAPYEVAASTNFTLSYNFSQILEGWSEERLVETVPLIDAPPPLTRIRAAQMNCSESDAQSLTFRVDRAVADGETVTVAFAGGFSSPSQPIIGDNATWNVRSWDASTETLTAEATTRVAADADVVWNISNFNAPVTGCRSGPRQGVVLGTDPDFGSYAFRAVRIARPLARLGDASVIFVADARGVTTARRAPGRPGERVVADLKATLYGAAFRPGDTLQFSLPNMRVPDCWTDVCDVYVNATRSVANATAKFTVATQILTITMANNTVSPNTHLSFRVGRVVAHNATGYAWPSNRTLALPRDGYRDGLNATAVATSFENAFDTTSAALDLPCAGVCRATLRLKTPRAGYATAFRVTYQTSFALHPDDHFSLIFNGGSASDCGVATGAGNCVRRLGVAGLQTKALDLGGPDGDLFAGRWDRNRSTLYFEQKIGDQYRRPEREDLMHFKRFQRCTHEQQPTGRENGRPAGTRPTTRNASTTSRSCTLRTSRYPRMA